MNRCETMRTTVGPGTGTFDSLYGVAAISPRDAWAAGIQDPDDTKFIKDQALVEHWSRHSWAQAPSPNRPHELGIFFAVSAPSATDAVAAGNGIGLHSSSYHTLAGNVCPG